MGARVLIHMESMIGVFSSSVQRVRPQGNYRGQSPERSRFFEACSCTKKRKEHYFSFKPRSYLCALKSLLQQYKHHRDKCAPQKHKLNQKVMRLRSKFSQTVVKVCTRPKLLTLPICLMAQAVVWKLRIVLIMTCTSSQSTTAPSRTC